MLKAKIILITVAMLLEATFFPLVAGLLKAIGLKQITYANVRDNFVEHAFRWNYIEDFYTLVDPVNVTFWCIMGLSLVRGFFYIIGGRVKQKKVFKDRSDYGSHGTARFQKDEEVKKHYYESQKGFILGDVEKRQYVRGKKYAVHSVDSVLNNQIIVFGPPGTDKTTGLILPNIDHFSTNNDLGYGMVITDPKGEIFGLTSESVEKQGYDVHVLDFLNMARGDQINVMDYMVEEEDYLQVAMSFVHSYNAVNGSDGPSDPLWDNGEISLLAALAGLVKQKYPKDQQNFTTVATILSQELRDEDQAVEFFKLQNVTGVALALYNNFLLAKDKTRAGFLIGLATKMTLFHFDKVKRLTQRSTVDINKLGVSKTALYVLMSDKDKTFGPVVAMFWTVLLNNLYVIALNNGYKLPVPVVLFMDELANIGKIEGLQEKLGTMRGRRIYPMMIWQSLVQMQDRYPDKSWEDVLSMCDTKLLLGANDKTTKEYFSEEMGSTTIEVQQINMNKKGDQTISHSGAGQSGNIQGRKLMFPDEIGRMDVSKVLVIQKSRFPVILTKSRYEYWKDGFKIGKERMYSDIPLIASLAMNQEQEVIEEPILPETNQSTEENLDSQEWKDMNVHADEREDPQEDKDESREKEEEVFSNMFWKIGSSKNED